MNTGTHPFPARPTPATVPVQIRFTRWLALLGLLGAGIVPAAQAQRAAFKPLHLFDGADGKYPFAALVEGRDHNFYGATGNGGANGSGTVFQMTPDGTVSTRYTFSTLPSSGRNDDGDGPEGALTMGADGNFYGMTPAGGPNKNGIIFRLTPDGVCTKMHAFARTEASIPAPRGANADGGSPYGSLTLGRDGNFYGTTSAGGTSGNGTVFQLTPGRKFTVLKQFAALGNESVNVGGAQPYCTLAEGGNGHFYGTTYTGGANGVGTVFEITADGVFTTLHDFSAPDEDGRNTEGAAALGGVIPGRDGNFYGVAAQGGVEGTGTVFEMTPAGVVSVLHSFTALNAGNRNADGAGPVGRLIQGRDGNFYGATSEGGPNRNGTVFVLTPAGALTTLHAFSALDAATANNDDGASPRSGVIQGGDGRLYGTATYGGAQDDGTAFVLTLPPTITSADTATARVGQAFSYQIVADNDPASYAVAGLKNGLRIDRTTGLISGTPTAAGKLTLTLKAANAVGTGEKTLTLTIGK